MGKAAGNFGKANKELREPRTLGLSRRFSHSDEPRSLLLAEIYRPACLMHRKADLGIPRPQEEKPTRKAQVQKRPTKMKGRGVKIDPSLKNLDALKEGGGFLQNNL